MHALWGAADTRSWRWRRPQLIERKMEQFKICERECKTKAFSKEGLAQARRLDPAEKAKQEQRTWLQDTIRALNEKVGKRLRRKLAAAAAGGP